MKLYTGGKAVPHRQNLFSVLASAEGICDKRAHEPFNPINCAYPISADQLTVGDFGKPGSDGFAYAAFPDDSTHDITVRAAGQAFYIFNASPQKHKMYITATSGAVNGYPLAPDRVRPLAKFCVGQHVQFDVIFVPPPNPAPTENPVQWTFDGTFYNAVLPPSSPDASPDYYKDPSLLQKPSTSGWWTSGGGDPPATYLANVGEGLTFPNGKYVAIGAKGQFSMHRPKFTILTYHDDDPETGTGWPLKMTLDHNHVYGETPSGYGADNLEAYPCAYFAGSIQIQPSFSGIAFTTQLIKGYAMNDSFFYDTTDNQWWLDLVTPYNWMVYLVNAPPMLGPTTVEFRDCPNIYCWGHTEMNWDFQDYVMFRPDGDPQNIAVPLGLATWHAFSYTDPYAAGTFWDFVPYAGIIGPPSLVDAFPQDAKWDDFFPDWDYIPSWPDTSK